MLDIIALIPSKDMREALLEQGRWFTDMETATLVHNLGLPKKRRRELLWQITGETQDKRLHAQIAFSLDEEQRRDEWFRMVAENYIFGVQGLDEEYHSGDMDVCFPTFELAFEYGLAMDSPFEIHKWRALQELPTKKSWNPSDRGSMRFAADGTLESTSLWVIDDDGSMDDRFEVAPWPVGTKEKHWLNYQFFEDRWVNLPNLYNSGDLVRLLDGAAPYIDPAYEWAVVDTDQERWRSFSERATEWLSAAEAGRIDPKGVMADFSDVRVTVEVPCKNGTFAHDHINPMFLEHLNEDAPEGSDEAELRKMASWAVRGECSLEYTSNILRKRILTQADQTF